ncbi:MAG: VWA domain-containing protein [Muribaculaceae bacterium]|nr:VWA domain-containing protein [Muribaculaceae bacterium]
MLTFAYPILLLLLLLLPLVWLLYYLARRARRKHLKEFGNPEYFKALMPDVSPYKSNIRIALRLSALGLLIIALARPWGGLVEQKVDRDGIEMVAVVDVSNSMLASASDNPEGTKRIDAVKLLLDRLVDGMSNDRVGLIIFAGQSYPLIPVSSDHASVKSFMGAMEPGQIAMQGTNIASALDAAINLFSTDDPVGKAIVLFTDVEDLENEEDVMRAVEQAKNENIQVDVVGVGSTKGVNILTPQGVFTDDKGEPVVTKLNEELGRQLAQKAGGIYVNASSSNALAALQKQLKEVKRSALSSDNTLMHDELFVYFAALALLLLVIDAFMVNRKNTILRKITFFQKEEK